MSSRAAGLLSILLPATALLAADFWKDKPAAQWTPDQKQQILTRSPWAQPATVSFGEGPNPGGGRVGRSGRYSTYGGGYGGGYGGYGGGYGGYSGYPGAYPNGPGMDGPMESGGANGGQRRQSNARPEILLRWESAQPLRDVAAATPNSTAKQLNQWAEEYYVVSATGFPLMNRRRPGQDPAQGIPNEPDPQLKETLRDGTVVKRSDRDVIAASKVETITTPAGTLVVFLFPRSWDPTPGGKDIDFECKMGPMNVKAKFKAKEMVYQGKPAF